LEDSLTKWMEFRFVYPNLAPLIYWNVWIERNEVLFEEKKPSIQSVVIRSIGAIHKSEEPAIKSPLHSCSLNRIVDFLVACFDGVAKVDGQCCGVGGTIRLSSSPIHKWYMNCCPGTNTKEELLGAWATLYLTKLLALPKIQILGDSRVIINWLNEKKQTLSNLS